MNEKWEELKALLEQEEENLTDYGKKTIELLMKEFDSPFDAVTDV
ncbi:hypothetical protein LC040_01310 [Bacillus tianshenii]|nr:hypothetical protein LC040_01310 [Bacillus tianshenii]